MKKKESLPSDCLLGINRELLSHNSTTLFWVIDLRYRLLSHNKAVEDQLLFNDSLALSLGESVLDLKINSDLLKKWKSLYDSAFKGESFVVHEDNKINLNQKNQKQITSIKPLFNLQNAIVGAICSVVDATDNSASDYLELDDNQIITNLNQYHESIMIVELTDTNKYELIFVNNQFLELTHLKNNFNNLKLKNVLQVNDLSLLLKKIDTANVSQKIIFWHDKLTFENKKESFLISLKPIFSKNSVGKYFIIKMSKLFETNNSYNDIENIKELLAKTLKLSNNMFCAFDKDGKFLLVSDACIKILGYRPDELIGKKFIDFVYELDKENTKNAEKAMLDGLITTAFENRYVHKNSLLITISWAGYWDQENQIAYSIAQDITDYKAIIKKTEESDYLLNESQIYSKMGSWNLDLTTNLFTCSEALYDVFGTNKTQFALNSNSFLNFVVPQDKERVKQTNKKCELTGEPFKMVYNIVTPKGEKRIIEEFGYGKKEALGKVTRVFGTAQDISERKAIEKSLEYTNKQYKYLFQNNPLPLFIFDFETLEIVDCNIEALLLYGYTREKFLQLTILDICPKEDYNYIIESKSTLNNDSNMYKSNSRHLKMSGEVFYVDITDHIITYENKKCSFVSIIDVSEKVALEKKEKEHIQFIETILENLPIGIAVNQIEEGTVTLINNNFSEIYGWPNETLTDFTGFFEKVCPDSDYRKELIERLAIGIQSKDPKQMQWDGIKVTTKTGEKRIVNAKNIPLFSQNLMISTVVDVTEKFNFQKNIEESNERYHFASKATSDAIWDWDLVSDTIFWGEGIKTLFGYDYLSSLKHSSKTWFDLIFKDDLLLITNNLTEALKNNIQNWNTEYRLINADGSMSFVNQKALIVRNVGGKAIRLVGSIQDITQLKLREQQLKLLESVITNTNDAVVITDANLLNELGPKILFVNDAFTKMTGYFKEEVIGKTPRLLQGPKSDKFELKKLSNSLKVWQPCEINTINYHKNGNEFWSNFAVNPVADENGKVTHWISIQRDITNKKIEEQKQILFNEISTIFNKTDNLQVTITALLKQISTTFTYPLIGLWLLDEDEQVFNLCSYHQNDFDKINLDELHQTNLRFYCDQSGLLVKVWKSGKIEKWSIQNNEIPLLFEKEIIRAGIQKIVAVPILFNSIVIGVFVIANDHDKTWYDDKIIVSEEICLHLGAEIKRKQLEQELSKIFNFSPDVVCSIKNDGKFKRINPVGCDLFGYQENELLSMNVLELIHPEDYKKAEKKIALLLQTNQTIYFEIRFISKKGIVKWMAWTASSTNDGLIYAVGKDIDARKKAENQLKVLNKSLVKQTQKLNISNEELEQFAYVASHDLQEPLRMVTSFLTLIEKKYQNSLDEKGLQYIKFAVEGAKNMRQIILDLLNFSRLVDSEDSYENIEVTDIINEVCLLQSRLIKEKNAKITFDNMPNILSIRHYLIQLFQNIISNALKYSKVDQPPEIVISSKKHKTHYIFAINDNGIGIEKEYFEKIFTLFQRLHDKEVYQGNGMGLAIVKKIVDKLQGQIWVESELGVGSTFFIKIPRKIMQ